MIGAVARIRVTIVRIVLVRVVAVQKVVVIRIGTGIRVAAMPIGIPVVRGDC